MTDFKIFDFEDTTPEQRDRKRITATPYVWRDPAEIPPRAWLYGRHYIRRFTSATVAPGGLAKTSLVLVEAVAIALMRPLLGIVPRERFNVWVWNGEDPREELERRIAAICQHYGLDGHDLEGRLFLNSGRVDPIKLAAVTRGSMTLDETGDDLIATIRENEIA